MATAVHPILLPGQPLPRILTQPPLPQCGNGCYEHEGRILASIIGRPYRDGATVGVRGRDDGAAVPDVDTLVTGTVTRITPQQAHLNISTVNNRPVPESSEEFVGVVRIADIRSASSSWIITDSFCWLTERDKIKMGECFRLGDLVKARVLSLGDARSYYLTTAANELGVVAGTSEAGNPLVPVSFQDMEDSVTGKTERRKVAKPEGI